MRSLPLPLFPAQINLNLQLHPSKQLRETRYFLSLYNTILKATQPDLRKSVTANINPQVSTPTGSNLALPAKPQLTKIILIYRSFLKKIRYHLNY